MLLRRAAMDFGAQPGFPDLEGVSAVSATEVWATGFEVFCDPFTCYFQSVIQHWDGRVWREVPSPDPEGGGRLDAIDAQGGGTMWSAGSFYDDRTDQCTLTLQAPSATQGQVVGKTNVGQSPVSWFGPVSGTTITDVFGSYSIAGLPAGTYILTVTYAFPGTCDPQSARVTVVANQTSVQDFHLDC